MTPKLCGSVGYIEISVVELYQEMTKLGKQFNCSITQAMVECVMGRFA